MPWGTAVSWPRRVVRAVVAGAIGGLALFALDAPATAQNSIVETSPADGSEVTTQPAAIVMTFENEVPEQRDVQVVCEGNPFSSVGAPELGSDGLTLTVPLQQALPAGDCTVAWTLSADDGGVERGDFSFTVSEAAGAADPGAATGTTTTVAGATATASDSGADDDDIRDAGTVSSAPIWLGRVLSIVGISVVFGSLVLIVAAWPEGPEYVLALRFLRSMWIVGLVGTLIYVAGLSAAVKGDSFSSGLNPASWFDLFDAGWPGRFAVLRVVLVVAMAWVVMKPERVIDPTTNMLALGIPALAVVTLGLSRTGGSLAFLGVVASILHVLAMAVWFGGAVLLARVVLAGPGDEDLVHAVRGFGRISNPAIVITLFSGLIQLYRLDGGELFSSGHGRVVLLKTVAVAAMVFVGMTARQIANARLARADELNVRNADRMRRVFGTEAAIGLLVIGLSGWLLALDPGKLPDDGDFDIEERFQDQALDFDVEVMLSPGRIGLNELEVVVHAPETGLSDLLVTFFPPSGASGTPIITQGIGLTGAGVARSGDGGGIPFDVAGTWRIQVSATTPQGAVTGINANVAIADEDGNVPDPASPDVPDLAPSTSTSTTAPPVETTEG
jgi:putative copper export protein/methionine-rich copper-binding protein CopC